MFIKAHVRGGYRAAAHYLNDKGENEVSRLVHMSDPDARDLGEAFHNMWQIASTTKAEKPLFHFSINPFKDERLTDKQVKRIVEAYAAKCNMDIAQHQHVIVEHIKNGRQHFHVFLNRVNQDTGRAVDPGLYKKKARECAREMEAELGLKRLEPKQKRTGTRRLSRARTRSHYRGSRKIVVPHLKLPRIKPALPQKPVFYRNIPMRTRKRNTKDDNGFKKSRIRRPEDEALELLIWAWENKRPDILATFGIILPPDYEF